MDIQTIIKEEYNKKKLSKTWSEKGYDKYLGFTESWKMMDFPLFNKREMFENPTSMVDGSILEIGSAAGAAHEFLLSNNIIDSKTDYTGMDISDKGISYCKKNFPEANWEQKDLTEYKFQRKYDYTFERIAVHHMENPLNVFNKMAAVTNKSLTAQFVSCLNGKTISDLSIARYRHEAGQMVYFNIINVFEVIEVMISNGFNEFKVLYHGAHEKCGSLPISHQYISPDVNWKKRMVGRTTLYCSKTNHKKVNFSLSVGRIKNDINLVIKKMIFLGDNSHRNFISKTLKQMSNRNNGVLFPTHFKSDGW